MDIGKKLQTFKEITIKYFRDFELLWLLVFLSLYAKTVILLGYIVNKTHLDTDLRHAFNIAEENPYYFIGFILIFISFSFLFKNRGRFIYLFVLNFLVTLLFLIDLWYYRGFNSYPTLHVLKLTKNLGNMSDGILMVIHPKDFILALDLIGMLFLPLILRKGFFTKKPAKKLVFLLTFALSVRMLAIMPYKDADIIKRWVYDNDAIATRISPLGFNIFSSVTYWRDSMPVSLTQQDNDEIRKWFEQKIEDLPDNKYKGLLQGKNIIHIDVESMENFMIGQSVDGQEITPVLNKLLKSSIYFTNIYEQVNQGTSSDADLIVNTSVYPLRNVSTFFNYPGTTYISMPKLMKNKGYSTTALHPDEGSFWNWMPALTAIGFDKCYGAESLVVDETFYLGITDASYLRQAAEIISTQKQPFYAFLPTQSSHSPFELPENFQYLKLGSPLQGTTLGNYFQAMRYADTAIGIMIDTLEKKGLMENTVLVIAGDHAGITKYHKGDAEKVQPSQNWWLTEGKQQIPLIIYSKDLEPEKIDTVGGQVDIMPTVSYLMGVDSKEIQYSAMGRNLLNTTRSFAVLADGTYVGKPESEAQKKHAIDGLKYADNIIKGDYFKNFVIDNK